MPKPGRKRDPEAQKRILDAILDQPQAVMMPLYIGPENGPGFWGGKTWRIRSFLNKRGVPKHGWRVRVGRPVSIERLKQLMARHELEVAPEINRHVFGEVHKMEE